MALGDIQTSFAGGELSPQLYARVDLDKFQVGAALLRNFFVDYRGGASNRAGFEYIDTVLPDGRLIPFIVSTSAAYVLVFTDQLVSIYNAGVFVTTVITPYAAEDLFAIQYTQSADVLTLTHPNYPPADLSRTSDTDFSYALIVTGPDISPPTITTMTAPHSGPYSFGYLITAVDLAGKEESLASNPGVKHSEAMNETTNRVEEITWTPPTQGVSKYNIYKWGPIDAVTMNPATVWGFIGTSQTTTFTDNNIAPDFSKQPPNWGDPFSGGQFEFINVNAGGSGYDGVSGDWPSAVPYVPLTIVGDGTGAAGYAVIDHALGTIVGVYLTNPGKNYTTATITANGQGGTGATFTFGFTDIRALNPAATGYLQQRRAFGGSTLKPETFVLSQPGLLNNFNVTPITLATDAVVESIAAEEVNTIQSFVQVNYGLIAFTTGGSFLINGGAPGAAIDANTISVQAQVSQGANKLKPLRINYDVVYGQAKGNRIHNLAFAWQKQSYTGTDISTLAAHLFDTFLTTDWAYAEEPFKIVWAVRNDGRLLSLTYVPDQDVQAWCRHDSQGLFKSVCSVPEGNNDAVYVLIQRYVPANNPDPSDPAGNWFWFLERMAERQGCCIFDAWFLDSALALNRPVPDFTLYLDGSAGTVGLITSTTTDSPRTPDFTEVRNFDNSGVPASGQLSTINWTNGRLATFNSGANKLTIWNTASFAQILAPTVNTTTSQGLNFGQDGFLYTANIATNSATITKLNPTTGATIAAFGAASAGFNTDATHWAFPFSWDVQEEAGQQYLISISGTAQANNEVAVLDLTTMAWTGFSTNIAEVTQNGVVTRGETGHAYIAACQLQSNVTTREGSAFIGIYNVEVGITPSILRAGSVSPQAISTAWNYITSVAFAVYDGTDDTLILGVNIIALAPWNSGLTYVLIEAVSFGGRDYQSLSNANTNNSPATSPLFWKDLGPSGPADEQRLIKVNKGNGAVLWSLVIGNLPAAQSGFMNNSSITRGQFIYFDTGGSHQIHVIDTIAGVDVPQTIVGTVVDWQFSNDFLGLYMMEGAFTQGAGSPVPIGGAPTAWTAEWSSFGLAPPAPAKGAFTVPGQVVQIGCGKIVLDTVTDSFTAQGTVIDALDIDIPDDPDGTPIYIAPGAWTLTTPVEELSGLSHLEGKQVTALADGVVVNDLIVVGGAVTLPTPATNIVVGLSYTSQIQTLYLTTEGIQEGSDQGKRKQISGVTLRVDCTAGILAGTDFGEYLTLVPETENALDGTLFTGDCRVLSYPQWDERGFTMVQQNDPLPASILGIIVEVTPGDTGS